jgi:hypothetical protein
MSVALRFIYQAFSGPNPPIPPAKIGYLELFEAGEIRVHLDAYPAAAPPSILVVPGHGMAAHEASNLLFETDATFDGLEKTRPIYQCFPGRSGAEGLPHVGEIYTFKQGILVVRLYCYPSHTSKDSFLVSPLPAQAAPMQAHVAPTAAPDPSLVRRPDGSWGVATADVVRVPHVPSGGPAVAPKPRSVP